MRLMLFGRDSGKVEYQYGGVDVDERLTKFSEAIEAYKAYLEEQSKQKEAEEGGQEMVGGSSGVRGSGQLVPL